MSEPTGIRRSLSLWAADLHGTCSDKHVADVQGASGRGPCSPGNIPSMNLGPEISLSQSPSYASRSKFRCHHSHLRTPNLHKREPARNWCHLGTCEICSCSLSLTWQILGCLLEFTSFLAPSLNTKFYNVCLFAIFILIYF